MSSKTKRAGNKGGYELTALGQKVVFGTLALICAGAVVTVIILLGREPQLIPGPGIGNYPRDIGGRGFVVTPENVEEIRAEIEAREARLEPEDMYFEFGMSPHWVFPTARTPSPDALVKNSANNSRTIFFDVYIDGVGVVYASPFMPLGTQHSGFALEYDLPPGTYSAVVTHFLVDDDLEVITDVSLGVTIIVEN